MDNEQFVVDDQHMAGPEEYGYEKDEIHNRPLLEDAIIPEVASIISNFYQWTPQRRLEMDAFMDSSAYYFWVSTLIASQRAFDSSPCSLLL